MTPLRGVFLFRNIILIKGERMSSIKNSTDNQVVLTKQEENIIRIMRNIEFGEVRIVITDGKPVRIEEIKKSIKL